MHDKSSLLRCFRYADENNIDHILVEIKIEDYPKKEIILIKNANFGKKIRYYIENYTEELKLKNNNDIQIVNFYSFNKWKILD